MSRYYVIHFGPAVIRIDSRTGKKEVLNTRPIAEGEWQKDDSGVWRIRKKRSTITG